ncbi:MULTISPECIES: putative pilus system protein FilC [Acinetobacter]|uniref:Transporter n=1 Tax=Acinetobacter ursingii TaxID=108980 RepID=A0A2N6V9J8_9GAMM|nr:MULTISPECIES: hypothetical protein [Acinetobacter]ENX46498.1 hypothetical protein F943_03190 [Acinetobacter ursingii NIPH 706]MEC8055839.1 hypothetical protein [Pseudomonadota bacterium]NOZ97883.1 hypothetical protein [Gammaproteobacteria bacterium]ENV77260.1 hypothetical protein F944_00638 [Acinetobacter ursingii DSM 16037 = CIP 107286]MCU4305504.1 hypothetical protein [Acinetobacter ursingii]
MMRAQWMNKTLLAVSIQIFMMGGVYAADVKAQDVPTASKPATAFTEPDPNATAVQPEDAPAIEPAPVAPSHTAQTVQSNGAAEALQKQEGDATQESNLQEVFTSNERQYSLIKRGEISTYYDIDYTYYRDSQLNLAIQDGSVAQLRVDEDATHTLTNTFTLQYGLRDNLTLSTSLPFVAKSDNLKDTTTAGLGDISFGARWEPFPLKAGRLPLILFGNISTKTGDSPYEVNPTKDLSTGKGYYSAGIGASTRKYIDPVVLFASVSANYGFKETGLNQIRGTRIIDEFDPGISGGFAFGFAYSFNYDVSLTMSYQQSFNTQSEFTYNTGETYKPADQTSATFSIALGVRVSPDTIVNGTLGIGLTEDAPDVSLGLSFPLDIVGFAKKIRN